jgi:hypothetical protein
MLKTVGNPSTRYGNQTIVDGNLVIGTAGKGIDFSADPSAAGMTSELLDDYEEGTWTFALSSTLGFTATVSSQTCRYTKIGELVTVVGQVTFSSANNIVDGNSFVVSAGSLPFLPAGSGAVRGAGAGFVYLSMGSGSNALMDFGVVNDGGIYAQVTKVYGTVAWSRQIAFSITYRTA